MILTHGGNSISRGEKTIVIGSNVYRYVKIGDIYWLADPFKEPVGNYLPPNGDSNNIPKYGYLYQVSSVCDLNGNTISQITNISQGFKVPTKSQLDDLISHISSAYDLFSEEFDGTNKLLMNLTPSGMYESGYSEFGKFAHIFSSSHYQNNSDLYQYWFRCTNGGYNKWGNLTYCYFQMILCKDA